MTDLFSYHMAKQQLTDLRKTADHTRLVHAGGERQMSADARRLITGVVGRISAKLTFGREGQASHTAYDRLGRREVHSDPEGELR